jgi:hypothetical protein
MIKFILFRFVWLILFSLFVQIISYSDSGFKNASRPVDGIPDGIWQASILRKDGIQIRFNFETRDSAGKKILYVMNGKERLLVDHILQRQDSVFIEMPLRRKRTGWELDKKLRTPAGGHGISRRLQ